MTANITYRLGTAGTPPVSTTFKNAPLNNTEIDGNFKSILNDLDAKANLLSPSFTTPSLGVATGTSFNSITGLSGTNPSDLGTAGPGSAVTVSRSDHVHKMPSAADVGVYSKTEIDSFVSSIDIKTPVKYASTANIASLSGFPSIDGNTPIASDRILVKNQTTASQNGIYIASGGAWSRAADSLVTGSYVQVELGTANYGTGWTLNTSGTIVLGTTPLSFVQTNILGKIALGSGLIKTANALALNYSTQLTITSNKLDLATVLQGSTGTTFKKIAIDSYGRVTNNAAVGIDDIIGLTPVSGTPSTSTFLRGDGSWVTPADVDTNTYPTAFAWTGGTTAGPTGSLTGTSQTVSFAAIPVASGTASGVVTTGSQSFAGTKTFTSVNVRETELLQSSSDGPKLLIGHNLTDFYYAGVGGTLTNGTSNTAGYLSFYTRDVATDASLTEHMRVSGSGIIINAPSSISTPVVNIASTTALGTTAGNYTKLQDIRFSSSNDFRLGTWAVRTANDTSWTSAKIHTGISVDASFTIPGTDTYSWDEKLADGSQTWGHTNSTNMTLSAAGALSVKSSITGADLKVKGATSGTATIVVPAVAGTPTLTLPTTNGTLALTSAIPTAGTGLTASGTTFNHTDSVTGATVSGPANKTLTFGDTFAIPSVTYNATGHITSTTTTTMTMPANPNTDTWNANALNVAGYVAAPSGATANLVWKTDASGNPAWRADADTIYTHPNPTTAGTVSGPANKTLTFGDTFTIPSVTYNNNGHITSTTTTTMTMPANPNTDTWNANALNVAGYVAAPTSGTANLVWKTDASGNPAWRADADTDTNYYPTSFSWTAGTTAGPTGSLTGVGMSAVSYAEIPAAAAGASGIVTTAAQTFAGDKSFNGTIISYGGILARSSGAANTSSPEISMSGFDSISLPKKWSCYVTDTGTLTNRYSYNGSLTGVQYTVTAGGDFTTSGNVTAYSDARIKTNIVRITSALAKVEQLNGYTFDRTDINTPRQTGVIAQEVLKVLPEAVLGTEEGTYGVAYGNMVGLLIEAIKELRAEVAELRGMK